MQDKQNKGVYSVIETCIVQYVCEIYFHGFDISVKYVFISSILMECESDTVINVTDIHAQPVDTNTEGWGIGVEKMHLETV